MLLKKELKALMTSALVFFLRCVLARYPRGCITGAPAREGRARGNQ